MKAGLGNQAVLQEQAHQGKVGEQLASAVVGHPIQASDAVLAKDPPDGLAVVDQQVDLDGGCLETRFRGNSGYHI